MEFPISSGILYVFLHMVRQLCLFKKSRFNIHAYIIGAFFEAYHPFHSLSFVFVYHLSLIFGVLGFTFLWPFQGLIGASPAAYGLLGACLSLVMFFRPYLDSFVAFCLPFILLAHIAGDILLYIYQFNENIGYASHFFGALTGFLFVSSFSVFHHKTYLNGFVSVISSISLGLLLTYLLYAYLSYFPPLIKHFEVFDNYSNDDGCCARYFDLLSAHPQYPDSFVKSKSFCSNGQFQSPFFNITSTSKQLITST